MEITPRPDGLITVAQAALLVGVSEITIRSWTRTGWVGPDKQRRKLPVARRDGWLILLDPVEVAKADEATRKRARRYRGFPVPTAA